MSIGQTACSGFPVKRMPNNAEYAKLLEPGTILAGKYRVDGILGKGGMGVVVAATHLALEQRVALKFLLPAALESEEATERFAREARAAVRLRSEHVARVLDVGNLENGSPYMVMELLDGQDLADRIATKELIPVAQAVDYVLQAGEAVAEAHALGIVHRDLKPRNLFLTQSVHGHPLVKVLDFGISKTINGGQELSLTRTSAIMGSPNYMSPEQLGRPRDVDGRSDVWSLGVILYELIAGRIPFRASTLTELCARVFQEEPERLDVERPEVPAALADVVHRCLAKKVEERFASVSEMARALAPFTLDPGIVERIERVAAAVPVPSAPRVSRASISTFTPMPSTAATSVSWSGAVDSGERSFQELESSAPVPRPRARLFPLVAAVGAVVVAIGAAAVTVSLTSHGAGGAAPAAGSSGGTGSAVGSSSAPLAANAPDAGALPLALDTSAPSPSSASASPTAAQAAQAAAPSAASAAPASSIASARPLRPVRPAGAPDVPRRPVEKSGDVNMANDRR